MTNTEKITAIENKIRGECEWLMQISLGCEVQVWNHDDDQEAEDYKIFGNRIVLKKPFYYQTSEATELLGWGIEQVGNLKVIGHPIQLSDLLYVIEKNNKNSIECRITLSILFAYTSEHYEFETELFKYNLSFSFKENLVQSEELCSFIYELICK